MNVSLDDINNLFQLQDLGKNVLLFLAVHPEKSVLKRIGLGDVMDLNADFSKRALVHTASIPWEKSEMVGVERRRLDRIRCDQPDEAVTTVVRYAPGSRFSPHIHTGGEEFLVLDGVFQDEHGDYPKGTYVRNPPTSSHSPGSEQGCTILVKLWYFDMDDRQSVVVDTLDNQLVTTQMGNVRTRQLYSDEREIVAIEQWAPGVELSFETSGGSEIFVLEGSFTESGDELVADSWLRVPRGTNFKATVGQSGAEVWIKKLQRNPDWI